MVISFVNHKGGVGKTTSVINIGAALASMGKKVLLIDADPQANLSQSLGFYDEDLKTINDSILDAINDVFKLTIYNKKKNLDVVPSCLDLSAAELNLSHETGREYFLREIVSPIKKDYDYILIDCAPSLGIITVNALTAADKVIIPVQCQVLALRGMTTLLGIVMKMQKKTNKELSVMGFLLTMYDGRTALSKQIADNMKETHGDLVFNTPIHSNVRLAEVPSTESDIFDYDSNSAGGVDYLAVAKEIIRLK